MSSIAAFYGPVFALVGLCFVLMIALGYCRFKDVTKGKVRVKDINMGQKNWPSQTTCVSNAFGSQFEVPVLFYVLIIFLVMNKQNDLWQLYLAWGYTTMRYLHAGVYVFGNNVSVRFYAFLASCMMLLVMWCRFAYFLQF